MIVNGLTDPRVQCPGGNAEKLVLDDGGTWWPCPDEDCIVTIWWPPLEGTHTLTCVNQHGASDPLAAEVPEVGFMIALVLGVLILLALARWRE